MSSQNTFRHLSVPSNGDAQAHYRELQILHAISNTISDTVDLKIMMERILDQALEIGRFDIGVICLLDPTAEFMEPVASRGYQDPTNVQGHRKKMDAYTPGAGSTQVIADKAVHVVDLSQTDGMRTLKKEGICTVVAVPLGNHEEVLGVIQLGSQTPREFLKSDLQLLQAIGDQAGIAVQKARLYEETKKAEAALENKARELARSNADLNRSAEEIKFAKERLEKVNSLLTAQAAELAKSNEEVRARYQELQTLQAISQTILDYVDLKVIMEVILYKAFELGKFEIGLIRLLSPTGDVLEPVASRGYRDTENFDRHRKTNKDRFTARVTAQVIAQQEIRVEDLTSTDGFRTFRREGVQSLVTVPLRTQHDVLGVIHLGNRTHRTFRASELRILDAIGRQAGIAIQKIRLYEQSKQAQAALAEKAEELARSNTELQETNRMLSALHAVASATSQSLELDRVLQAAIAKINDIFHFDATRIHLYDERTDEIVLSASLDNHPDRFNKDRSFRRGQGVVGQVVESGKPVIFEDVESDPLYQQLSGTKVTGQFGYRFFAVLPIQGKLTCLGTLACVGAAPRKLTPSENQLLEAIADQIAVAIENSKLYERIGEKIQELQQKTSELAQANKAKDEFLSIISHELRTPLNVVLGYSRLLKEGIFGEINAGQKKALETVLARADDQLLMINSVLQVTKIEAGAVSVANQEINLSELLDEVRATYDLLRNKELTLHWDYSSQLPLIKTDRDKLKHIFQNLVNNAIKFTEKGKITIDVRYILDSMVLEFKVSDTGVGIPQEKLPLIFEMFRQLDSSSTRRYEGVGVGLYIVKKFTELLGGNIDVQSEPDKGSTFTIRIPCEVTSSEHSAGTTYLYRDRASIY